MDAHHFIQFFKRSILGFWHTKIYEGCSEKARREPNVPIFRTVAYISDDLITQDCSDSPPVESIRIDKIWSGESSEPRSEEADSSSDAKGIRSKALRRYFTTNQPGKWTNGPVIDENVQYGEPDDNLACGRGTWVLCVDDGVYQLTESAEDESNRQEYPPSSIRGDDEEVNDDGCNADGDEDTAVFESVADVRHFKEISAIS